MDIHFTGDTPGKIIRGNDGCILLIALLDHRVSNQRHEISAVGVTVYRPVIRNNAGKVGISKIIEQYVLIKNIHECLYTKEIHKCQPAWQFFIDNHFKENMSVIIVRAFLLVDDYCSKESSAFG